MNPLSGVLLVSILSAVCLLLVTFFVIKDPYKQIHLLSTALCVIVLALASISINTHNRLPKDKKENETVKSNYVFSIIILLLSLFALMGSFVFIHPKSMNILSTTKNMMNNATSSNTQNV